MPQASINFGHRISFGLESVGRNLGVIGSAFFRLGTLFLFFWYLCEFKRALWANSNQFFACALMVASFILAAAFLFVFFTAVLRFNPTAEPEATSVAPFIWLTLLPMVVVLLAGLLGAHFTTPLLKFTQENLNRIWQYLF